MVTQEPTLAQQPTWDGKLWQAALRAGTAWLEHHQNKVNELNVFPVPDGDTGTNMVLTMRAALRGLDSSGETAAAAAKQASLGALMGARGNSGVILSQILSGIAVALDGHRTCDARALAQALVEGANAAYSAVAQPVEGTILTVARAAAEAAEEASRDSNDVASTLRRATAAAAEAVRATRDQLPVLQDAGVVDAGGEGYRLILEGMLQDEANRAASTGDAYIVGDDASLQESTLPNEIGKMANTDGTRSWGYCTQFLILGANLNLADIREIIRSLAEWSVVIGTADIVRVHGHTDDPGQVLSAVGSLGRLADIHIEDMDLQVLEQEAKQTPESTNNDAKDVNAPNSVATVAVAAGDGLAAVLRSLGASRIILGGQSMNPSMEELLEACKSANSPQVLLLPNNRNVILAAEQLSRVASDEMELTVVPTTTIVQGIAAQLAFNGDVTPAENAVLMVAAARAVRTIELTRAVRDSKTRNLTVRKGQFIALVDDELVAQGPDEIGALREALDTFDYAEYELVSIYPGANAKVASTEAMVARVAQWLPSAEIEVTPGGQPHYHYIIGLE